MRAASPRSILGTGPIFESVDSSGVDSGSSTCGRGEVTNPLIGTAHSSVTRRIVSRASGTSPVAEEIQFIVISFHAVHRHR